MDNASSIPRFPFPVSRSPSCLVDTHAHLDDKRLIDDLPGVVQRACEAGIEHIVLPGVDLSSSKQALAIGAEYPGVYPAVGISPHDAAKASSEDLEAIRELARRPGVVAIGEIGLDYHYYRDTAVVQQRVFREQLDLATELGLPVIVHQREAVEDVLRILGGCFEGKVVMHCFGGDEILAETCLKRGYFISLTGIVTFRKADHLREVVRRFPLRRIMLETDSPYMAPVPKRGKRNEPAYLLHIAEKVAELFGMGPDDVARITTHNAVRFFRLPVPEPVAIVYPIRNTLYINVTSRCTNDCTFCMRFGDKFVHGHNLALDHEPTVEETVALLGEVTGYEEVCFCGLGEPMIRLDYVKAVAREVKSRGGRTRLDTNGLGNLIHGRDIVPDLVGLIDSVSISLNCSTAEEYDEVCHPKFGSGAFAGVLDFVQRCRALIGDVRVTAVAVPGVDTDGCRHLAEKLGVGFRLRDYHVVE